MLFRPRKTVIYMVTTYGILCLTNRYHVDTLARGKRQMPVVTGHTSNDMIVRKLPMGTHMAVLNPNIRIILCQRDIHLCILYENGGMGFAVDVHNLPLVVLQILNTNHRGNHLTGGSEMIELTPSQGQDSHLQLMKSLVSEGGICSQSTAKLRIEVVFTDIIPTGTTPIHQQTHRFVTEHPDTDIRQIEVFLLKFTQRLYRGLLQHLLQDRRRLTTTDKDTVVLRYRGIEPETIADNIRFGNGLQGLGGTDEDIATDHHRMDIVGSHRHHLLIKRQLQTQQVLRQPLAPFPTEYGDGRQYFSRRSIGRETTTLSTCMEQDALFLGQPSIYILTTFVLETGLQ